GVFRGCGQTLIGIVQQRARLDEAGQERCGSPQPPAAAQPLLRRDTACALGELVGAEQLAANRATGWRRRLPSGRQRPLERTAGRAGTDGHARNLTVACPILAERLVR